MENRRSPKASALSAIKSTATPQNELAMKFAPGTSVQVIKDWVNFYVAQARNNRIDISFDSFSFKEDGLVIVYGRNIRALGQTGGAVMQGESHPIPTPPRPHFPENFNYNDVKGMGQKILATSVAKITTKPGGR